MADGIFLVLDGLDGCGKSTQARRLSERLRETGRTVIHTREPGGTALGEQVRDLLLDRELGDIAPLAEVFLYQASRAQLVDTVVAPALAEGHVVVCERWHYATRAYQGAYAGVGRAAGEDALRQSSQMAVGETEPQRAILLDMASQDTEARIGSDPDRLESRGETYRRHVAERFRAIFAEDPQRCRVVSAAGSMEDVEGRIWEAVRDLFD